MRLGYRRGNAGRALRPHTVLLLVLLTSALLVPAAAMGAGAHRHRHRHRHHHHALRHRGRARSSSLSAACPDASTPATAAPASAMQASVVCLVNRLREAHGLPALTVSAKLDAIAQSWSRWMVAHDQFTHGSNFGARISSFGYDWQTAGENIATGADTPRAVVLEWLHSRDHCRNMFDPSFRDIGVGLVPAPIRSYATEPSTWTQDFGLTMNDSPLSGNTGPMNGCPY